VQAFFPKVVKVKDAYEILKVTVTDADNKSSLVKDHNACAMAVACKHKTKADGVIISVTSAYIIKGDEATRYKLPGSVSREVVSFDRKAGFMPGDYQLVPFSEGQHIGMPHSGENKAAGSHSGNLKKRFIHRTEGVRAALGSKKAPDGIVRSQ